MKIIRPKQFTPSPFCYRFFSFLLSSPLTSLGPSPHHQKEAAGHDGAAPKEAAKGRTGRLRSFLRTASKGGSKPASGRQGAEKAKAPAPAQVPAQAKSRSAGPKAGGATPPTRPAGPTIVSKKEAERLIASAGGAGEGDKEAEADKAQFIEALRNAVKSASDPSSSGTTAGAAGTDGVDISDLVSPDADYKDDLSRLRAQLETARLQAAANGNDEDSSDFFSDEEG